MRTSFNLPRILWGEPRFEFNLLHLQLLDRDFKFRIFSTLRLFNIDLWHIWFMSDSACGITLLGFELVLHWD